MTIGLFRVLWPLILTIFMLSVGLYLLKEIVDKNRVSARICSTPSVTRVLHLDFHLNPPGGKQDQVKKEVEEKKDKKAYKKYRNNKKMNKKEKERAKNYLKKNMV